MTDETYTTKEFVEHYMNDMKEQVNDIHSDVKEIKIQTSMTNGRVSKLEWWRNAIIWGFSVLIGSGIPLFIYYQKVQSDSMNQHIRDTIVEVLDQKAQSVQYAK